MLHAVVPTTEYVTHSAGQAGNYVFLSELSKVKIMSSLNYEH